MRSAVTAADPLLRPASLPPSVLCHPLMPARVVLQTSSTDSFGSAAPSSADAALSPSAARAVAGIAKARANPRTSAAAHLADIALQPHRFASAFIPTAGSFSPPGPSRRPSAYFVLTFFTFDHFE